MAVKKPIIAIVGRPNVGKSTLFNRILGSRQQIVEDFAGVTRDRAYALIEHYELPFYLVDTGGFESDPEGDLAHDVVEQVMVAAEEANLIIALFDAKSGLNEGDKDVVKLLRRYKKPVIYVVNKCDGKEQAVLMADFYALGVDRLVDVSALHGRGVQSMIEEAFKMLPNYSSLLASVQSIKEQEEENKRLQELVAENPAVSAVDEAEEGAESPESGVREERPKHIHPGVSVPQKKLEVPFVDFAPVYIPGESSTTEGDYLRSEKLLPLDGLDEMSLMSEDQVRLQNEECQVAPIDCIKVAVIGRPNVGKSTLLNTLTGERRAVTSDMPGTTIDTIDLKIRRDGQDYLIIDTAGLRKKARVGDKIEKYSVIRSLAAISECDVAVLLIDAVRGLGEQDAKILGLAHEQGKAVVIAVNKWDLLEKDHHTVHKFKENLRSDFKFAPYAPIVFISALSGKRCPKVIEEIKRVAYERSKRAPTYRLNKTLRRAQKRMSPARYRGRAVKLLYGVQVEVCPPRFLLYFNYPKGVHFSYLRFLKNCIRDEFGFEGTDIKLATRKRSSR